MKTNILLFLLVLTGTFKAQAGNLRCMPTIINHVLRDFEQKRQTTGLVVTVRNQNTGHRDQQINLGRNLEEESVVISDVHKNSFRVDIPLRYINHKTSNLIVLTYVMIENYNSCKPALQGLVYKVYEKSDLN